MKKIEKTTFIAAVAATTILAFAVGCGSESPAAAPTEVAATPTTPPVAAPTVAAESPAAPPSEAAQVSANPDGAQTPADAPDLADFMDEDATRLFEEMTPAGQRMVRDLWDDIRESAPREAWMDVMGQFVTQIHADAKIRGEVQGVEVAGVQDLVDPSKGPGPDQSVADSPPFVLGLLPPKYLEAYQIIPEGSLMREYMDNRLGSFSQEGWEAVNREPNEPYSRPAPELNARDEAELMQMLRDAGGEDWLVERVRSLDADAGQEFQAAGDVEERLGVLRRLVVEGKMWEVLEIREEWKLRAAQWSEERIADFLENVYRSGVAEMEVWSEMTPTEFYLNSAATMICGDLMNHIVGQDPRTATFGPAECDIDKVIALTEAALDAGQAATSEEEFRTAIEYYEETGQWRFSVSRSSPEGE